MAKLAVPKATTARRLAGIPKKGEILFDKETNEYFGGDGATQGGKKLLFEQEKSTAFVYGVDRDAPITATATDSHQIVLNNDYDYDGADPEDRYVRVTATYTGRDAGKNFSKMPAHNLRRCIVPREWLKDAINHIYTYLNPSDSRKRNDGTPLTANELAGRAGDFCVHMPKCYIRDDTYIKDGVTRYVYLVSLDEFPNSKGDPWFYSGPGGDTFADQFAGAFPSVVCTSDGEIKAQDSDNCPVSLGSTDILRSIPGARPAASINRTNFRKGHARNGGLTGDPTTDASNEYDGTVTSADDFFMRYVIRMMLIEFNSFDFKSALSVGYAYGKAFHYTSLRTTGRTLGLGNGSGEIPADDADSSGLDWDILHSPAFITASSEYERYEAGDTAGVYAWKFGTTVRYTASATPTANVDYCYTDTALSAGGVKITAYTAAGTNWNASAESNPALKVVAMSWRGFENIYGSAWQNPDGCQKNQDDTEADITSDGVVYDRYLDGDYASGTFHSYAWKSGATVIYTLTPHPAVNDATYSDNTCETNRGKPVTAWDEDYSQSGLWVTNDSTLYFRVDSDLGIGSAESAMPASGHTGANVVFIPHPFPKAGGYVTSFDPWTFFPTKLGGNSTIGLACYFYNDTQAGPRLVLRGAPLTNGAYVSPAYVYAVNVLSYASPGIVSRLAAHQKRQASAA